MARDRPGAISDSPVENSPPDEHLRRVMKFILTTHNVTLTDAIEQHVLAKLDKLEHKQVIETTRQTK